MAFSSWGDSSDFTALLGENQSASVWGQTTPSESSAWGPAHLESQPSACVSESLGTVKSSNVFEEDPDEHSYLTTLKKSIDEMVAAPHSEQSTAQPIPQVGFSVRASDGSSPTSMVPQLVHLNMMHPHSQQVGAGQPMFIAPLHQGAGQVLLLNGQQVIPVVSTDIHSLLGQQQLFAMQQQQQLHPQMQQSQKSRQGRGKGSHQQMMQSVMQVSGGGKAMDEGLTSASREIGNRPNHGTNVHDQLGGKCAFHAYRPGLRRKPLVPPAHANAQVLPIFVQMFPSELIHQALDVFQDVIATVCTNYGGIVERVDHRSETSFIAFVRTSFVWHLISLLRCRVLMDRHGFWYATDLDRYVQMKEYCEGVRRLPQQQRHYKTDGLPCMPLVVELGRMVSPETVVAPPAPPPFDSIIPISNHGNQSEATQPQVLPSTPPTLRGKGNRHTTNNVVGAGGALQGSGISLMQPYTQPQQQFFFNGVDNGALQPHMNGMPHARGAPRGRGGLF